MPTQNHSSDNGYVTCIAFDFGESWERSFDNILWYIGTLGSKSFPTSCNYRKESVSY